MLRERRQTTDRRRQPWAVPLVLMTLTVPAFLGHYALAASSTKTTASRTTRPTPGPAAIRKPKPPTLPPANNPPATTTGGDTAPNAGEPAVPSPATFRIKLPADGSSVRGVVKVDVVPGKNLPDGSYVSFTLDEGSKSGVFKYATVLDPATGVFEWDWDTSAESTSEKPLYPDGKYTIHALAHDPLGHEVPDGVSQAEVTVANAEAAGGPFHLSYHLTPGDFHRYLSVYKLAPDVKGGFIPKVGATLEWNVDVENNDPDDHSGWMNAFFTQVTMDRVALVLNGRGTSAVDNGMFQGVFDELNAGFSLFPNGDAYAHGRGGPYDFARSGLASEIYVPLPAADRAVNIGDTWKGAMMLWTIGNPDHRTKIFADDTTSTLSGVEWVNGIKCVKIHTTYAVNLPPAGQKVTPKGGGSGPSLGGQSASFGGRSGSGSSPIAEIARGKLTGDRTTWLDFEHGVIVRVSDKRRITNLPNLFQQDQTQDTGAGGSGGSGSSSGHSGMSSSSMSSGMMNSGGGGVDMSWLPGYDLTDSGQAEAAMNGSAMGGGGYPGGGGMMGGGGYPGGGMMGGYPGGGMGGYPGMVGGGYPGMPGGGYPGMPGGGYPGMPGGGYPGMPGGGYPGMPGGGYPGMPGGGYPGMPGGGYPGMMGGGYPGGLMGALNGGMSSLLGGGYPGGGMGGYPGGGSSGMQQAPAPPFTEVIDSVLRPDVPNTGNDSTGA